MAAGRRQLFIYWRVDAADTSAALQAVQARQRALQTELSGLVTGLLVRQDAALAQSTLMETYGIDAGVSTDGVTATMQAQIEAAVRPTAQRWLRGTRHLEVFDAVDA